MPSDARKKKEAAKKLAAKGKGKKPVQNGHGDGLTNGTNGADTEPLSQEGCGSHIFSANICHHNCLKNCQLTVQSIYLEILCRKLEEDARLNSEARACTGVLGVHPKSRDVKIDNLSITFHGVELINDTKLELNCGRRYGLIGLNGSGKSTLLAAIGNREVPIPDHIDIYHLTREIPASEKTALQCVMEVDQERIRLEKLADELALCEDDGRSLPLIVGS